MNYNNQYEFYKRVELDANNYLITSNSPTQHTEIITELEKIGITQFFIEVNKGNIAGTVPFNKFGRNGDIDTGQTEDIWSVSSTYTGFPTEVETLEVFSTNANDTAGGTGARDIVITNLLDASFNPMPDVYLTLNGTTPVSLGAGLYSRCTRIVVLTAGSTGENQGNITLRHTTTTSNVFAVITPGDNQTQIFAFTVPLGKTLYIPNFTVMMTRANGSAGSANISVKGKMGTNNVWNVIRNIDITDSQSYKFDSTAYFVVSEGMDIVATINSVSDNNTRVTGEANGFLVDN